MRHPSTAATARFVPGRGGLARVRRWARSSSASLGTVTRRTRCADRSRSSRADGAHRRARRTPSSKCRRRRAAAPASSRTSAPEAKDLDARNGSRSRCRGSTPDKLVRSYPRRPQRRPRARGDRHPGARRARPSSPSRTAPSPSCSSARPAGITIYQFDPGQAVLLLLRPPGPLCRRAEGGGEVHRGQVLGYVGISGNAPKNTPHLHFAVFRLTAEKQLVGGHPDRPLRYSSLSPFQPSGARQSVQAGVRMELGGISAAFPGRLPSGR